MMAAPSLTGTTENLQLRHFALSAPSFILEHYTLVLSSGYSTILENTSASKVFTIPGSTD